LCTARPPRPCQPRARTRALVAALGQIGAFRPPVCDPGRMAQPIRDVLNRRTDLSTFVVHLTRDRDELPEPITAREALESIVEERYLRAERAMGMAKDQDDPGDPAKQTQRVVCFSETPLEHIYSLVADIEGRRVRLRPYGLAMTKLTARRMGIGPLWYVNQTTGSTGR
jgi:hypothetical protein